MNAPGGLTATALLRGYRDGSLSVRSVVAASLARIEQVNPRLNCFCDLYPEESLAAAEAADARLAAGEPLAPLFGVPIAIKDLTPIAGKRTTSGSVVFADHIAERDAVIVERLKAAGAILIGKTTTPEFAYSGFTQSPLFGITRNPWDSGRTPGGSSGGSGAAVASGCVPLAEGSDMGGSIRIPAAFCGIIGLKPSFGRIPFDYLPSQYDSLSHLGPLARCVADAALFLQVCQGPDSRDPSSLPEAADLGGLERGVAGLRLALSPDLGFYAVEDSVAANLQATAERLRADGAEVVPVDLGFDRRLIEAWNDLWAVFMEGYFGHYLEAHRQGMDPAVVALIEQGRRISGARLKAIEILRSQEWRKLAAVLDDFDALLTPTCSVPAPPVERQDGDFDRLDEAGRYRGMDMTGVFNLFSACPAISLPSGLSPEGLPTGLQIVGRRFADGTVLRIAGALEAAVGGFPVAPEPDEGSSRGAAG
ncbi:MAG: amidase family protein [Rhodospirillales bacterium]